MSGRFRPLEAEDIEIRVAQATQKGVSLLLYKTARTDANMLDEVIGESNWQNDFKVIDGVLFGGIGIKENGEWVWKWDCGTESNTEKEKGEASDAFKRAGFKWGIGRELYTAPFIWVGAGKVEVEQSGTRWTTKNRFVVSDIAYENGKISHLTVRNASTNCDVFWYERTGAKVNAKTPDEAPWTPGIPTPQPAPQHYDPPKRDATTLTDADIKRIADVMQNVFAGHKLQYKVFERLTGYKATKTAMKAIPRKDFMRVIQAINLTEDRAVEEITKQEEIERAGKTA